MSALREPGAGSDLAGLACRPTETATTSSSTGRRCGKSAANFCDRACCSCAQIPKSRHHGITFLLVDMDSQGSRCGHWCQPPFGALNEVFLAGCFRSGEPRLGPINERLGTRTNGDVQRVRLHRWAGWTRQHNEKLVMLARCVRSGQRPDHPAGPRSATTRVSDSRDHGRAIRRGASTQGATDRSVDLKLFVAENRGCQATGHGDGRRGRIGHDGRSQRVDASRTGRPLRRLYRVAGPTKATQQSRRASARAPTRAIGRPRRRVARDTAKLMRREGPSSTFNGAAVRRRRARPLRTPTGARRQLGLEAHRSQVTTVVRCPPLYRKFARHNSFGRSRCSPTPFRICGLAEELVEEGLAAGRINTCYSARGSTASGCGALISPIGLRVYEPRSPVPQEVKRARIVRAPGVRFPTNPSSCRSDFERRPSRRP